MEKSSRKNIEKNSLSFISETIKGKKKYIFFLLCIQVLLGINGVLYALSMRFVIDEAVKGCKSGFIKYIFVFIGIVMFQIVMRALLRFMEEFSRSTYENLFKRHLFEMVLTKDYGKVTNTHSGEWMNRLTSDTVIIAEGLTTILPGLVGMVVKIFGALSMILYIEPRFACILIPGGVVFIVLTLLFRKILKKLHKKMQEKDGEVRIFLQEYLNSLMIVKAFSTEENSITKSEQKMNAHKNARMKKNHFSNVCNVGFSLMMQGIYVIGLVYCGFGILNNTLSYGTLMSILQLISQIQNPFANISGYLPKYYAMIASAERLLIAEDFENDELDISNDNIAVFDKISMKDVSFAYNGEKNVLSDFSLNIEKGDFVAITGNSGIGKSTVLKLLLGLYRQNSGEISPQSRCFYAYVPQGNYLMSNTIREVVSFSESEYSKDDKRIIEALKISCAEFVLTLPEGIDTKLGERGLGLSEGQMQRISIARAVFSDRPVLILDEATSALDEFTEKELLENLRALNNKTVIIITHRMAVLEYCDKHIKLRN